MTIMTLYSHMYMSKYFFLAYICTIWRRKAITDHIYKPQKKLLKEKNGKNVMFTFPLSSFLIYMYCIIFEGFHHLSTLSICRHG